MKHYCVVGLGQRGLNMFVRDLHEQYADVAEITGVADTNPGRVALAQQILGTEIPGFTNVDVMLRSVFCDVVIIASPDFTHDDYIVRALEYGKDVITEKPLAIDADRCRRILVAEQETGHSVRVIFNARYIPYTTEIKRLLSEGIVGEVHSAEFQWHLDTVHGADYFRRWHAQKQNSGGLMIHKATHHFDLMNWWLDLEPEEVVAMGGRHFYESSRKPGHGQRCATCEVRASCEFYLDLKTDKTLRTLYLEQESYDGYYRDRCVFNEDIDIEDTVSLLIRYPGNVQVTYAFTAATPFEGWNVAFQGSQGRLEAFVPEAFVVTPHTTNFAQREDENIRKPVDWRRAECGKNAETTPLSIHFYPLYGGVETFTVNPESGSHGGGDRRLKDQVFRNHTESDPLHQLAGSRAGVMSALIGVAANRSMTEHRFVSIWELLEQGDRLLERNTKSDD